MAATGVDLPVVGITMGDAAGIGPEILLKSLSQTDRSKNSRCVIIGDLLHLRSVAAALSIKCEIAAFNASSDPLGIEVFDLANLPSLVEVGRDHEATGRAAAEYIEAAVNLWRQGTVQAICTAPISKKAIAMAGYDYPGHTEFLAELTHTPEFAMSFFADPLRVVLLSTHLSLRDGIDLVKRDRLDKLIRFTDKELSKLLGKRVSIAVAGLNPHASESGMFGREEEDEIRPAITACIKSGVNVSGPYSPDTIFVRGSRGEFDVCIALYHDQATIAVKCLSFGSGVNVTLGLPLIRTSVDHGTAFDIAGKGIADESSMNSAIALAGELAMSAR
jgi:4-phospho-D-threonate 3-dehydrogenase / 4-phospho-D-erythronate 3-dehydrogenase